MTITETTTVAEIAASIPSSVRVFQRHGIDFCCGGQKPLAVACNERHLAFADIALAIDASVADHPASSRDWTVAPLHDLVDHIVTTYHDPLRAELPRLVDLSSRVARVHGGAIPVVAQIARIVHELSADLLAHMQKEERVLFPSIVAREQGAATMPLAQPIRVMEWEHDYAGELLTQLRTLTNDYRAPEWECATVRALYDGLRELESEMHLHVHLENNVLFPRAQAL
jgi:regulator of cell morphogenesis and NO signaling